MTAPVTLPFVRVLWGRGGSLLFVVVYLPTGLREREEKEREGGEREEEKEERGRERGERR